MKKITLFFILILCIFPIKMLFGVDISEKIQVGENIYTYFDAYMLIDSSLEETSEGNIFKKYELYTALKKDTLLRYNKQDIKLYRQLADILQIGINTLTYRLTHEVQKVEFGTSEQGKEIYAYVKGIPENQYKLVVANIHGAYEYGTYETAQLLIQDLKQNDATGWIVIPTLNPDGLDEYFEKGNMLNAYLDGRDNNNQVDLNRNFCSKNFILRESDKYGKIMKTGRSHCESESETRAFLGIMQNFPISHVISLHSTGGVFYIPDGSIDDAGLIGFTKKIHSLIPDYDFYPDITTPEKRVESIVRYEIDEGGLGIYTGTLENYVYENYGIPTVLIELNTHGNIEERLRNIFSLDIK